MTTQEKKDFILSRRNWLRTKTGRWALRKATGDVADTVAFRWDFMTVVNGRVCYAVCKATGLALRDSFRHAGVWYIPERAVRLTPGRAAFSPLGGLHDAGGADGGGVPERHRATLRMDRRFCRRPGLLVQPRSQPRAPKVLMLPNQAPPTAAVPLSARTPGARGSRATVPNQAGQPGGKKERP